MWVEVCPASGPAAQRTVILGPNGATVDLPAHLPLERAVAMNEEAQTYDGVRAIDSDARVHFMPYAIEVMKSTLGFDCPSFTPGECVELAMEQIERFRALERRLSG